MGIMKSLISAVLIFGAAVMANATGTAPPPPPPPPPAPPAPPLHYRPPVHYRPRYGPPSHGGGLEGILPLLLLGKNGGHAWFRERSPPSAVAKWRSRWKGWERWTWW